MKYTFSSGSTPLPGYTIKRAIHRGGFGEVYYGHIEAGKEVALKLLQRNQAIELRGVNQCINLNHPNLVTIFDVKRDAEGDDWIIMEYVSGGTLTQIIEERPNGMSPGEIWEWLPGIVAGVVYLHESGIVHRDLKPGNIYRQAGPNGLVKVGDVGLSKMISDSQRHAQTQSVGTVYYMAPEVSKGNYGQEVDIYSLAVIVYEMYTGRVPFDGRSTAEILLKHLSSPPDLTRLPAPLRNVIARGMEKDPRHRTPSAQQFLQEYILAMKELGYSPDSQEKIYISSSSNGHSQPTNLRNTPHLLGQTQIELPRDAMHAQGKLADPPWWRTFRLTSVKGYLLLLLVAALMAPLLAQGGQSGVGVLGIIACGGALFACYQLIYSAVIAPRPTATGASPPNLNATVLDISARPVPDPLLPNHKRQAEQQQRRMFLYGVNGNQLTPETVRYLPWKHRLTELAGSMTVAIICTLVVTLTVSIMTSLHEDLGTVCYFAAMTLLGSWMVLTTAKLLEGTGRDSGPRKLSLGLLGLCLGLVGWGLHRMLLVSYAPQEFAVGSGLFDSIGPHPLVDGSSQPTLLGYLVFFAGLFLMRRWWWQVDSFRESRFRVSSVLVSLLVGFAMTTIFTFPIFWGMTLAAAISAVVQLSAPWVPPEQRVHVMEGI